MIHNSSFQSAEKILQNLMEIVRWSVLCLIFCWVRQY